MHVLASHFYAWLFQLSMLALGTALTFTNSWFTADVEHWAVTGAVGSDTAGTLTFKNTGYLLAPEVILVPVDGSFVAKSVNVTGITALLCTINQVSNATAPAYTVIVRRRR